MGSDAATDDSSDEWMRRAAQGDAQAFGQIVRAYQHRVQAFAVRMLGGDTDAARDVAQETFLRLWQVRATYEGRGCLLAYLLRIAGNLCRDAHRTARPTQSLDDHLLAVTPDLIALSPDDKLRAMALADVVRQAISELPDEQRAVFVMSHYEGMAYREIAEALGCPMGTVASRKHLAVESLRRRLKDWIED
jgi:RNA polymerase sigma-70 factor (ECF subfamily)